MTLASRLFIFLLSTAACGPMAFADAPAPGNYATEGSSGTLTIEHDAFQIDTIATNGHTCGLSGTIKGNKGYTEPTDDQKPEDQCVVDFGLAADSIELSPENDEACRQYFGANAYFSGTYYKVTKGCSDKEREDTRNRFQEIYDAGKYRAAYKLLDANLNSCRFYMGWIEIDNVRNDLAITQYHMGNKKACLKILQESLAAKATGKEDLQLAPYDLDNYLPTAQASWFNMKKCGGKPGSIK